ncbi:MAG: helix-turn-helix domain-containing protein [Deltaproteobacteria bacterium]|nr:MAG: helix-turn-helix domain-containing protein [Deltaproteobacteria bacterium]TMQ20144.1 MAG: helix-turn-helix domain-containing protein [Deltaproteobacteria bacterium]
MTTTRYVNYKQAAEYLAVPVGTLRSLVCHKRIPHVRLGPRSVKFELAELDQWIAEHRVDSDQADQVRTKGWQGRDTRTCDGSTLR